MQHVFVLSSDKQPLDPCHPARARKLLRAGKAAIFRHYPFAIILKGRTAAGSVTHAHIVKIDPGSRITGLAVVHAAGQVVWAAEVEHRGEQVVGRIQDRAAHRKSRRSRHTRYRPMRWANRRRREGWLPPSMRSRLGNTETWVARLRRYCPVSGLAVELVKFDTQQMQNPEISGVEYQQGTLLGYEVRAHLLEKWARKCVYCGRKDVPLEIEHIVPRSRGGSKRVSNLTLACHPCNQAKGSQTAAEFGHPDVQAKAQQPLKDAAAMNATRWAVYRRLQATGLPVECGTGGRTCFNRARLNLPKAHWLDAACVGESGATVSVPVGLGPLRVRATGHNSRQMCRMDKYGFPRTEPKQARRVHGFQTGDLARADIPAGKHQGTHTGRVAIRSCGRFNLTTQCGTRQGISWKHFRLLQQADGYTYSTKGGRLTAGAVSAVA